MPEGHIPASPLTIAPHFLPKNKGIGLVNRIRRNPLGYFQQLANHSGSYAWLSLMRSPVLFLNDATAIDYIFNKGAGHYHKGKYNEGLRPLMGDGVFLAEGESWWKQRRDMAAVFANKNFPEFVRQINLAIGAMLERWEPRVARNEPIDISQEMPWLTFDVILRALYHEESDARAIKIRDGLGMMLRMAEKRIWSIASLPMLWSLKLPRYKKIMNFLNSVTEELIKARQKGGEYPEDLLSRMLACHEADLDGQKLLRDNILSFMLAGQETTGNAIAWSFYELSRHSEIRQRLTDEIDNVLCDAIPVYETAKKLTYARQVFCEVLRMYAPAWTMSRHAISEDVVPLEDGRQLLVPKESTVMLCAYTVHHSLKYWKDPESFTPERFTPEEIAKRPKGSWFPYGGGNRLCLGFKLAELEGMLTMALVYQKYNVHLIPGQQVKPEPIITIRPDRPIWVRLTPRSKEEMTTQPLSKKTVLIAKASNSSKCPFSKTT